MEEHNLDDTYDLLSPLRRSYIYSDSFVSSKDDGSPKKFSSTEPVVDPFSDSNRLPSPIFASTGKYPKDVRKSPKPNRKVAKIGQSKIDADHDTTKELMKPPPEPGTIGDLTVWEDWLVKKVQAEREMHEKKRNEMLKKKEEKENLIRKEEERKKKAAAKHQQWCEEKVLELKLKRASEKREQLLREELKSQKDAEIQRKAKAAYVKWSEQQKQRKKDLEEKERQKKEREVADYEIRKKKNEECFKNWLNKLKERDATSPRPKSAGPNDYPSPSFQNPRPWVGPMSDRYTRESVRRQHKQMVAEKHTAIQKRRSRPASSSSKKGLVKVGPQKNKGVLICRPASANPVFHNIPNKNNNKFMKDTKTDTRGRS